MVRLAAKWGFETINLWVLAGNAAARRWYEKRGWKLAPGPILRSDPPHIIDVLYEFSVISE